MEPLTMGLIALGCFLAGGGTHRALTAEQRDESRQMSLDLETRNQKLQRALQKAKTKAARMDLERLIAVVDSHRQRMERLAAASTAELDRFLVMKLVARQLRALQASIQAGGRLDQEDKDFLDAIAGGLADGSAESSTRIQVLDYIHERQGAAAAEILLEAIRSRREDSVQRIKDMEREVIKAESSLAQGEGRGLPAEELALRRETVDHHEAELKRERVILEQVETTELLITKAPELGGSKVGDRLERILSRVLVGSSFSPKDRHFLGLLWQQYRDDFEGYKATAEQEGVSSVR